MTAIAHFPYHYPVQEVPHYRWKGGLIVDNFAGGGGASTGIWKALGVSPDFAVNHDAKALAMHAKNHPTTKHFNESEQVRMVGNSVPPGMACAFVQANVPPWALARKQEMVA